MLLESRDSCTCAHAKVDPEGERKSCRIAPEIISLREKKDKIERTWNKTLQHNHIGRSYVVQERMEICAQEENQRNDVQEPLNYSTMFCMEWVGDSTCIRRILSIDINEKGMSRRGDAESKI